jgi:sterol 3beta-glucosyltransferase
LGLGKGPVFAPLGGYKGGMATRIYAVSPSVIPRPDDWDDDTHMTGYWFLDEGSDWQPDEALAAFLDAGEPPVYIGFGSMTTKHPDQLAREIVEGVRRAGIRAILATGWGGLAKVDVPDTVHVIEGAPHTALFKHVSAVVHHGGAGTTAAGLRAGRPTLVCPLTVDQPFWAHRVWKLGCGPKPQSLKRLRATAFAQGLKDLLQTDSYQIRAATIARDIATEDGIARAIEIIASTR